MASNSPATATSPSCANQNNIQYPIPRYGTPPRCAISFTPVPHPYPYPHLHHTAPLLASPPTTIGPYSFCKYNQPHVPPCKGLITIAQGFNNKAFTECHPEPVEGRHGHGALCSSCPPLSWIRPSQAAPLLASPPTPIGAYSFWIFYTTITSTGHCEERSNLTSGRIRFGHNNQPVRPVRAGYHSVGFQPCGYSGRIRFRTCNLSAAVLLTAHIGTYSF